MKRIIVSLAASIMAACGVWSTTAAPNVVGYVNVPVRPGNNLIANQLVANNFGINSLLANQVPDGSTFTKWDPVTSSFLPPSIYDAGMGLWDINYTLGLGEGGLLQVPSAGTVTFVGEVYGGVDPLYWPPPARGPGIYLASYGLPIAPATFEQVLGRSPLDGESVTRLNSLTQTYFTTTFDASLGAWDNGVPGLVIGEAAFFNLGPVPEPTALSILCFGAVAGWVLRRRQA